MQSPSHRARHSEPAWPSDRVALTTSLVSFLAFLGLLGVLLAHGLSAFNRMGLWWVHSFARRDLDPVALGLTSAGSIRTILAVGVLLGILLLFYRRILRAFTLAAVVGGDAVLTEIIKYGVREPRPHLFHPLSVETSYAFPSGHTLMSFGLCELVAVWVLAPDPRAPWRQAVAVLLIVFAALVGLSRLYLGVHWPGDTLASLFVATSWGFLVLALRNRAMRRWPAIVAS